MTLATARPKLGLPGRQSSWRGLAPVRKTPGQQLASMSPAQKSAFQQWISANKPAGPQVSPLHAGLQYAAAQNKPRPLHLAAAQEGIYRQQRNEANESYGLGIAENDFQRGQANQGFAAQLRDLTQQYGEARGDLPDAFVGRGILDSGVFRQSLQELVQKRLRLQGDLQNQRAGANGAYDLGRQTIERQRAAQLAAIEAERQRAMAQFAAGSIK